MRSIQPMSLATFRIFVVLSAVLLTVMVGVGFFAAPEIGSAYLMIVGSTGNDLPALTAALSIPLLRIGPDDPHERPVTKPWVGFVWFLLGFSPAILATWAFRASTMEDALARWVAGLSIYMPCFGAVALAVIAGLALPMACM